MPITTRSRESCSTGQVQPASRPDSFFTFMTKLATAADAAQREV